MKRRTSTPFLIFLTFIALVALACNAVAGGQAQVTQEPEATPLPTEPPQPTQPPTRPPRPTPTEAPPDPTSPPAPTEETQVEAPFELANEPFFHPSGIFELYPPVGWMVEQDDGSVLYESPDGVGAIYLQATNTGYPLDEEAFGWFVEAREMNFFGDYDGYVETDRQLDGENGTATVTKMLRYDGIPQTVLSFYSQYGQAIYALDFWADEGQFDEYADQFDRFFDGVVVDSVAVVDLELYDWIYTFYGPDDIFSIEVPSSWYHEVTTGEFTVVDTFYSPDDHAIIQNVAYDEGVPISKSEAGAFALELLRSYYAEDITITDDQVQSDGSERLTWHSQSGGYRGVTFFESRGTTFLLFTAMYDDPYEDIYLDVLDYTISTYEAP
jgi:hypothetical protein